MNMRALRHAALLAVLTLNAGCVGTIIDATTDAAVAVVKIPFRIGHAAVDAAMGRDEDHVEDHDHAHDADAPTEHAAQ